MRRSQHTELEIHCFLSDARAGVPIAQICGMAGVSPRTFYRWRVRYGGVTAHALLEVKNLQLENSRLRALVTSLSNRMVTNAAARREPDPAFLRHDLGSAVSSGSPDGGASLGRFAFVRGHR